MDRIVVVLGDEVDDARVDHVRVGTAQRLGSDLLAGYLLDDLGPGDEHLGLPGHDDEISEGRGVRRPPAHGPQIKDIWGTAPESSTFVKKTRP